jgi:hypothetical protein
MTLPLSKSKRNLLLLVDPANSRSLLVGFVHREAEDKESATRRNQTREESGVAI